MTGKHGFALMLVTAATFAGAAGAQDVIRCGNSYGQQPCAGGTVVPVADPRSEAQRAQTSAAAERDAKLAAGMERTRLKAQAEADAALAAIPQAPAPLARSAASKPAQPAVFKATAPAKPGDGTRKTTAAKKKNKKAEKKSAA